MRILTIVACGLLLAGCGSSNSDIIADTSGTTAISSDSGQRTIGVNRYLWAATLDRLSFLPPLSEDPFGGVIIYDWYSMPQKPSERIKVIVYIKDVHLRADGLKVAVFRQILSGSTWVDTQVSPETASELEKIILTRARELRLATQPPGG